MFGFYSCFQTKMEWLRARLGAFNFCVINIPNNYIADVISDQTATSIQQSGYIHGKGYYSFLIQ